MPKTEAVTVLEMVKGDLEEQGLPDNEIQAVISRLSEDANWFSYLSVLKERYEN